MNKEEQRSRHGAHVSPKDNDRPFAFVMIRYDLRSNVRANERNCRKESTLQNELNNIGLSSGFEIAGDIFCRVAFFFILKKRTSLQPVITRCKINVARSLASRLPKLIEKETISRK